jgi:hypothetical protein
MSRWLGTREDQAMAARLIAEIAQLFATLCAGGFGEGECVSKLGGSEFIREEAIASNTFLSSDITPSRMNPLPQYQLPQLSFRW